jgi:hypothetical protein
MPGGHKRRPNFVCHKVGVKPLSSNPYFTGPGWVIPNIWGGRTAPTTTFWASSPGLASSCADHPAPTSRPEPRRQRPPCTHLRTDNRRWSSGGHLRQPTGAHAWVGKPPHPRTCLPRCPALGTWPPSGGGYGPGAAQSRFVTAAPGAPANRGSPTHDRQSLNRRPNCRGPQGVQNVTRLRRRLAA